MAHRETEKNTELCVLGQVLVTVFMNERDDIYYIC